MSAKGTVTHQVGSSSGPSGDSSFTKTKITGSVPVGDATMVGGHLSTKDVTTVRGLSTTNTAGAWISHEPTDNTSVGISADTSIRDFRGKTTTTDTLGFQGSVGSVDLNLDITKGSRGIHDIGGSITKNINLGSGVNVAGTAGVTKSTGPGFSTTTKDFGGSISLPTGPGKTSVSYNTSRESGTFGPSKTDTLSINTKIPVSPGGGFVTGGVTSGSTSFPGGSFSSRGYSVGVGCTFGGSTLPPFKN